MEIVITIIVFASSAYNGWSGQLSMMTGTDNNRRNTVLFVFLYC